MFDMFNESTNPAPPSDPQPADATHEPLTPEQTLANVIRLAFGGDQAKYAAFCDTIRRALPEQTEVVLRGSAVTGRRWKDGAPFDANGPGTSDLDLTFVGEEAIKLFKLSGFYVPGVHSRPVSEKDPEIAPNLIPLREALMAMVGRPVNIQATRDFVMHLRGDLLGQPYLVVLERPDQPVAEETPAAEDKS